MGLASADEGAGAGVGESPGARSEAGGAAVRSCLNTWAHRLRYRLLLSDCDAIRCSSTSACILSQLTRLTDEPRRSRRTCSCASLNESFESRAMYSSRKRSNTCCREAIDNGLPGIELTHTFAAVAVAVVLEAAAAEAAKLRAYA